MTLDYRHTGRLSFIVTILAAYSWRVIQSRFHARTKHIEVHYHFIREKVLSGEIDLEYVNTEEQVADIFTKALGAERLRRILSNTRTTGAGVELEGEC